MNIEFTDPPGRIPGTIYSLRDFLMSNLDTLFEMGETYEELLFVYFQRVHYRGFGFTTKTVNWMNEFAELASWVPKFRRALSARATDKSGEILEGWWDGDLTGRECLEVLQEVCKEEFEEETRLNKLKELAVHV